MQKIASLKGKVILATVVGVISIIALYKTTDRAFDDIISNIDRMAHPNHRLHSLNHLFRTVSQLSHLEQKEVVSGRSYPSVAFLSESRSANQIIDTLRILFHGDSIQLERIDEISSLLNLREDLFTRFLEMKSQSIVDKDFFSFFAGFSDSVSLRIEQDTAKIREVRERVTTTTVVADTISRASGEERTGFFRRLFGRSDHDVEGEVVKAETRVDEEVIVSVDTIYIQRSDESLFTLLEKSLDSLETARLQEAARLQSQELQLVNVNTGLINEIISIINAVEQEEIGRMNAETQTALSIAGNTIRVLNVVSVLAIAGFVVLILLIIIDISKSNKYRKELEKAHEEARNEADARQKFLSNMSHEIRTPLQSIYGYLEQAKLSNNSQIDVETLFYPAEHLLNVVNEVLDYSRVTSGKMTFEKKAFSPHETIMNVVKAMKPMAEKKNLKLETEFGFFDEDILLGDPFRLQQILFNLVGNALKFTEEGHVLITANLRFLSGKPWLDIYVEDTGIGIASEKLPELFMAFSQSSAETVRKYGGTGLGLSIVKQIVELQGGRIDVESTLGQGTGFVISIPYEKNKKAYEDNFSDDVTIKDSEKTTVWVADDDPLILNLAETILKKYLENVRTFPDGNSLLKAFDQERPNIIFIDMRMPGITGAEVCQKIRKRIKNGEHIYIYALTAQVLPEEQHIIKTAGFDNLIKKPFREKDLVQYLSGDFQASIEETSMKIDVLKAMAGDEKEHLIAILDAVASESRKDLSEILNCRIEKNWDASALVIHRLAGRAGQTGAMNLAARLREVERVIRSDESDPDQFYAMIDEVIPPIENFIEHVETLSHQESMSDSY
ncbi:hybrid sensor histidine kinase/response regulator [Alkalitalea saponilacus]|uniref:histidine kinase n=1 Tax=Alkalitalea saponilacus TaxID=889453 RepID=A0A1T5GM20_9BACT|nr:ATP-binding protein [Alkalitalea saponilacus]ASB48280.1 hypothetical protein CDL62_03550 [Alkalitalea saponilacus]SKC09452.1 His Kinase A (phospho-acceptor) domain-containing protein [Alkalitalea saponilacus]